MPSAWNELDDDLWRLQPDEMSLLPGMTDKGRLGFALQLKFRQINGRYPERLDVNGSMRSLHPLSRCWPNRLALTKPRYPRTSLTVGKAKDIVR